MLDGLSKLAKLASVSRIGTSVHRSDATSATRSPNMKKSKATNLFLPATHSTEYEISRKISLRFNDNGCVTVGIPNMEMTHWVQQGLSNAEAKAVAETILANLPG